jgi:hypothetical protein
VVIKDFFVKDFKWKLLLGWYFHLSGLPLSFDFVYALLNTVGISELVTIPVPSLTGIAAILLPIVEIFRFIFGYIFACFILPLFVLFIQKFESLKKYERPIGFYAISIILALQFLSLFFILPFGFLLSSAALFSFEVGSFVLVWPLYIIKILLMILPLYLLLQLLRLRKRTWKVFVIWLVLFIINLVLDGFLSYLSAQFLIKLIMNLIMLGIITRYLHGKRQVFVN